MDDNVNWERWKKPPPRTLDPRDKFSTWSIVLITVIIVFSLTLNNGESLIAKAFKVKHAVSAESVSTDSFERLQAIDTEVKTAYVASLLPRTSLLQGINEGIGSSGASKSGGIPLSSFHQGIRKALTDALDALRRTPDSLYFARRVILLRQLLAIYPLGPVTKSGSHKGMTSPLSAFDLYAAEAPQVAPQIKREKAFWAENFSWQPLPPAQLPMRLSQLKQFPTMLFYGLIVRQQLYLQAGSFSVAKKISHQIELHCLFSMAGLGLLGTAVAILFLIGVVIWIGSLGASLKFPVEQDEEVPNNGPSFFDRFLVPLPETISQADRKMRAGDLLDCFAIYLLSLTALGTVLSLLAHLIPDAVFKRMSVLHLTYVNIGFDVISYVGSSALAYYVLLLKARKRGASLAVELGLTKNFALKNILYGAAGWGTASVLLIGVGYVSHYLLHKLPAPENPALPLLSFAPNTLSRFTLYLLAAVAAPFFEETFFRGVLLNALLLRFRPVVACVIVGLMFGGIHPVGVADALTLAALGGIFAWMAYLRKSLVPSMFAHFMQNSYAFFAVYFSFALIMRH